MTRFSLIVLILFNNVLHAQNKYELNEGWTCAKAPDIQIKGTDISNPATNIKGWQTAVVPGTVLTTLLAK